eukprot:3915361-Alexandrium_andersonii.AAC.1
MHAVATQDLLFPACEAGQRIMHGADAATPGKGRQGIQAESGPTLSICGQLALCKGEDAVVAEQRGEVLLARAVVWVVIKVDQECLALTAGLLELRELCSVGSCTNAKAWRR